MVLAHELVTACCSGQSTRFVVNVDKLEKGFINSERAGTSPLKMRTLSRDIGVAVMYEPSTERQKGPREPRGLSPMWPFKTDFIR